MEVGIAMNGYTALRLKQRDRKRETERDREDGLGMKWNRI